MKLSEIIIKYRNEHSFSQRQMGSLCNLSTGYISLIEKETNPQTGKRMIPSLPVLNKLATGMGMTLDDLLSLCDDMDVCLTEKETLSPAPAPSAQPQLAPMEQSVLDGFRQLNEEGQDKVKSYIDDLLRVDIYKKGCGESFVVSKNA